MNLARNFNPDAPEGFATHLKEGFLMGWIPGIIIDVNDPEKLNRVKVEVDLIEPNRPWPNANDGWVSFMESCAIPMGTGGSVSHKLVGARVVLLPMMGSPTNLIAIGFLHNRSDRPSELTQSIDQTYGIVTPGSVYSVKNDREASRIDLYPHGVMQTVTKQGDITQRTEASAQISLTHDGNCTLENPKCFTSLANTGLVQQGNESGAISVFHPEGQVDVMSPFGSALSLRESQLVEKGPISGIAKDIAKLSSFLPGKFNSILSKISSTTEAITYFTSARPDQLVKRLIDLVDDFTDIDETIGKGLDIIDKVSSNSPLDLAKSFAAEFDVAKKLGLADTIDQIKTILPTIQSGNFLNTVIPLLPNSSNIGIRQEEMGYIEQIFDSNPDQALKSILDLVIPEGISAINNLFNFDLLGSIDKIEDLLKQGQDLNDLIIDVIDSPPPFDALPEELEAYQVYLADLSQQKNTLFGSLGGLLPSDISLNDTIISDILSLKDSNDTSPAQLLIGHASKSLIDSFGSKISSVGRVSKRLSPLIDILDVSVVDEVYSSGLSGDLLNRYIQNGIAAGEDWQDLGNLDFSQLLNRTLVPILSEIENSINDAVGSLRNVVQKLPDAKSVSSFILSETKGIISCKGLDHGGAIEISQQGGELLAPDNLTKLAIASGAGEFGSVLGKVFFKEKGIESGVEVLDFIQAKLKKFSVEVGMKKGFRVKISPTGISIGLNGFPSFPNLSRLAKEMIGDKLEIKEMKSACDKLESAFATDSPGMNMSPGKLDMGSQAAPIKMRSSKIGVAGTDFVPFVSLTESAVIYLIEHLFNTAEFVLATHFDYNDYSNEYGSNTWQDRVNNTFPDPEEKAKALEYLASIQGKAGQLTPLMKAIIVKQINPIEYLREMFEFTEDEDAI